MLNKAEQNATLASKDAILYKASIERARLQAKLKQKVVYLNLLVANKDYCKIIKKQSAMLNRTNFQLDYIKEACIEANILNFRFKIMPCQNLSI